MIYSTRSKLIVGILFVSLLPGSISLFVGGRLLYDSFLNEARTRISLDLNAMRGIYLNRLKGIELALSIAALDREFIKAVEEGNSSDLGGVLNRLSHYAALDFAGPSEARPRKLPFSDAVPQGLDAVRRR